MRVALVHPPTCDPTAPYLALPSLAAFLRARGVEVLLADANLEAWEGLLTAESLARLGGRVEERLRRLERRPALDHREQLACAALWRARADAAEAPRRIGPALDVLRGMVAGAFFDPARYGAAVGAVESALRVVSGAYAPLAVDFAAYRTPFSMLDAEEIERGATRGKNPFFPYYEGALRDRLAAFEPQVIGVSMAFPGQLEQGFALGRALRNAFPEVPLVAGGPALTQLVVRLDAASSAAALGPFDTAVLFEGEEALLELVRAVERKERLRGVVRGSLVRELGGLPPPDFDGLPLDRYLSPSLVLPYDPSRGCYHGRCAFCHYGLAESGTAPYRERAPERVAEDLSRLAVRHGTRLFHLSEDTIAPRLMSGIARELAAARAGIRFATDVRPEPALRAKTCEAWAEGGLIAAALGVESASPRVLELIGKGLTIDDAANAIDNLSGAGVAVEAMCFTDFPTETAAEALETIRFLERRAGAIALFMCGAFDLVHGAAVARNPAAYGIAETWSVAGDAFGTGLFYREARGKTEGERRRIDAALDRLSARYAFHRYPFAGSLSTAHSLLWFAERGPAAFQKGEGGRRDAPPPRGGHRFRARYDAERICEESDAAEARIWDRMVHEDRAVSRADYGALSREVPRALPSPCAIAISPGGSPKRVRR
jgi:anaerobic magnesium-protoporphyrin IX monomethyl ester cyclase